MTLFVDTSTWFANLDGNDGRHFRARRLIAQHDAFVLTDHVLVETWLLAASRLGVDAADRFWRYVVLGGATLESVTDADLARAWQEQQVFGDQGFSIVDCTSFVVMQRLGLRRVASFDDDFVVYRYGRDRRRAFEVVR